jgi:hypothetical protein
MIKLLSESKDRLKIVLPYSPAYIGKIKAINGYRWHPDNKYWTIPRSKDILTELSNIFAKEKIYIDPALQSEISPPVKNVLPPKTVNLQTDKPQPIKSNDKKEKMAVIIFPLSFRCDCKQELHFFENTIREMQRMSEKKKTRLGEAEHTIVFYKGEAVEIHCPSLGICAITGSE